MTVEYQPVETVKVDGDAATVDHKLDNISTVNYIGSVASSDGKVSHIIVDSNLDQSELDKLSDEFGVRWEEREERY